MISEEVYKCAVKYYNLHIDLDSSTRIKNIYTIFGISRTAFYAHMKKDTEITIKKNNIFVKVNIQRLS